VVIDVAGSQYMRTSCKALIWIFYVEEKFFMTATFLNSTVERIIPEEVIIRLKAGIYKLYGGVVRWAEGTIQDGKKKGGQIVCHLLPFPDLDNPVNTFQLNQLSGQSNVIKTSALQAVQGATSTQQVLQVATNTMILSGLNLVVTAVSFAVLNDKLKNLECKLNKLQQEVKAIRILLELEERSKLAAALRDLLNINNVKNNDHRNTILFNSKNVLAPISLKYKELLAGADTIEIAMAYEEYYCLTSLAHSRCLAELGMLEMAHHDLGESIDFWRMQARRIANEFLFGKHPERFLYSDFSQEVPVSMLVEWMDFSRGEEKGYRWIDELRKAIKPWYSEDANIIKNKKNMPSSLREASSLLREMALNYTGNVKYLAIDEEKETIIPAFQKLVARNSVLDGFVAQYELLEKNNVTPTEFERMVSLLKPSAVLDGYIILQPIEIEAEPIAA
jgi:hypothetical protein